MENTCQNDPPENWKRLSKGKIRLKLPIVTASTASNLRPVNISSFALDLPTILGRRCVPPALCVAGNGWYKMEHITSNITSKELSS
jgi:hypothetical protein